MPSNEDDDDDGSDDKGSADAKADEKESTEAPKDDDKMVMYWLPLLVLFLVSGLDTELNTAARVIRIAFVVSNYPKGTSLLRGKIFKDELDSDVFMSRLGNVIRFEADIIKSEKIHGYENTYDVCIVVKQIDINILNWCRYKNSYIIYDVLDHTKKLSMYLRNTTESLVDLVLVPNKYMQNAMTNLGISNRVLYHQHTNPGIVRASECIQQKVKTIGFLAGSDRNLPSSNLMNRIKDQLCKSARHVQLVSLSQQLSKENDIKWRRKYFRCHDDQSIHHILNDTKNSCHLRNHNNNNNKSAQQKEAIQAKFHDGSTLHEVDIAIIWPAVHEVSAIFRPSTRLLYWMSHGIPCIFYPNHAYTEIAQENNYKFPMNSKYKGDLLSVSSITEMVAKIKALTKERETRVYLHNTGLNITKKYDTKHVAYTLAHIVIDIIDHSRKSNNFP